jgi:hypothetical protein
MNINLYVTADVRINALEDKLTSKRIRHYGHVRKNEERILNLDMNMVVKGRATQDRH